MQNADRIARALDFAGLQVLEPFVRLAVNDEPRAQIRKILLFIGVPALAFGLFLLAWAGVSKTIVTKYGTLPTPPEVWQEAGKLWQHHKDTRAAEAAFYVGQAAKAETLEAAAATVKAKMASASAAEQAALEAKVDEILARAEQTRTRSFSSSPTYVDQIVTSLETVFAGFLIASLIAIPLGILCGLSPVFQAAIAPLVQIFKPVSPLAWLPIVMIVVGALYTTPPEEAWFAKSFISSAFTVALCSLWPTLVNTALGVSSIDKDHINVARVLKLDWWTRIRKIVIPSALPLMFTGLRISLGVGWMVLIAAEMLAQNPGLGKFVWDMFQNGSSQTLAQIMVAVFTIGIIGFALDRIMVVLQKAVSFGAPVAA
jgi:nitrate/nitrite transport system permease protein